MKTQYKNPSKGQYRFKDQPNLSTQTHRTTVDDAGATASPRLSGIVGAVCLCPLSGRRQQHFPLPYCCCNPFCQDPTLNATEKMHTIDCRCFQWRPQSLAVAGKAKAKAKAGAVRYFRGCSCCKLSGAFVLRFLLVLMIDTVPSSFARPPSKPPVTTGSPHGHGHNRVTVCCIGCLFVFVAPAPLSLFSCMLSHFTSTRRPIRQPDCCNLCVIFYFQFAFSAAVAAARGPGINCI